MPGLAAGGLIGISAILLARRWRGKRRGTSLRSALPYPGIPGRIGRYEIRELLGTGEVATTRKGFDPVLHRDVVVKLLHPHLLGTVAARRMEREGRALARLNHPAIPGVIEIVQRPGVLALVEEYIAGESLAHVLAERGALGLTETLAIVRSVASALDHAHQNDVVHHDLKPGNILIAEGQRAYLLDFGLAAFYDDESIKALTPQGKLLGTAAYMSPEQIRGKRGDHRSDVYSLGVVLYEMLTGESPFEGGTPHDTQLRQVNEEPPERPLAGLPRPVRAVIEKALRKAPDRRYQSAGALADALERAVTVAAADGLTQADVPRDQVVATTASNPAQALERARVGGTLADDEDFREAKAAAGRPDETGGFLYLDVADALPLLALAGYAGVDVPKEALENLRPISSVVAWSQADGTTSAQTVFVHIQ
ncbi:MAG: serine/threonine protein kinase [Actinobacteria bacterium]|nr:serine/threonine protein kinase [Actinomycetota bacterium]